MIYVIIGVLMVAFVASFVACAVTISNLSGVDDSPPPRPTPHPRHVEDPDHYDEQGRYMWWGH